MRLTASRLAPLAIGLLTSCASPAPVTAPAIPPTPPAACLTDCPTPPMRTNPRQTWERQIEDWAYACLSRHQACTAWARRLVEPAPTTKE